VGTLIALLDQNHREGDVLDQVVQHLVDDSFVYLTCR
jgi:hypothetical protein